MNSPALGKGFFALGFFDFLILVFSVCCWSFEFLIVGPCEFGGFSNSGNFISSGV